MRARGLKHSDLHEKVSPREVAPHAGAWIETTKTKRGFLPLESRPMRARGLKQFFLMLLF